MNKLHSKKIIKNKVKSDQCQTTFWELLRRFFVVWFLMFFCALVITQQESFWLKMSHSPEEIVFVLPWTSTDWGIVSPVSSHGAADWSYLFEDEETDNQISPSETPSLDKDAELPLDKDDFPFEDESISYEWDSIPSIDISSWALSTSWWSFSWIQESFSLCITPWGEYVAHGDFVLAYEQRKDVTNLCNVQKRYCNDWKLTGSYPQKSCKEHTLYSYVKPEAISSTQKPVDPFIQPQSPSLSWADFDTHGKINGTSQPGDVWWSPSSGRPSETTSVSQTVPTTLLCVTPWGERVKNGQFVKAYKSSVGLIDMPCEVELRLCVKWKLKWSYANRTCVFKKMTYRDYLIQNYDQEQPTVGDLLNTVASEEEETTYTNSSFWKWLDKYF